MELKKEKFMRGRALWHALASIGILLAGLLPTGCSSTGAVDRGKNWEKHITEETVFIEGLEGEYTLLFLTDTHMVVRGDDLSKQEKENEDLRFPEFVNEEGVTSFQQFSEWICYANERKVDAVLFGGDIIDTPSAANLQWLEEQLSRLNMPYLYVNGNHDWTYPWEYMTSRGKETFLPLLEPFMQRNTVIQTLDFGEFKVVGIDDSTNQVAQEALEPYGEILKEGRPVIVMAHVPFMTQSVLTKAKETWDSPVVIGAGNFGGIYPNEASDKFTDMTLAADSPVELVLAGHVHFYDRDVMEGEKKVLQLVGGAGFRGNAVLLHVTGRRQPSGT